MEAARGTGVALQDIAKAAGVSRQAIYLHFANRTELLLATTRYVDNVLDSDARLAASRASTNGRERLAAYIDAWGRYIPEIYGIGKAIMASLDTDDAAATAWADRMAAMRHGCEAAINALAADGELAPEWTQARAVDVLWTMLLIPNWEQLTERCGWTTEMYIEHMQLAAARLFVADHASSHAPPHDK